MLCCYLNVFVFVYIIDLKEYSFHFYGLYYWMHRCQHSLKKSLKSISCSGRINQIPRNFLCWQPPSCFKIYYLKSMVLKCFFHFNVSKFSCCHEGDWFCLFQRQFLTQLYEMFVGDVFAYIIDLKEYAFHFYGLY